MFFSSIDSYCKVGEFTYDLCIWALECGHFDLTRLLTWEALANRSA